MPRVYIKWSSEKARKKFHEEVEKRYNMQCKNIDNPAEYEGLSEQDKAKRRKELRRTNEELLDMLEEEVFNTQIPTKKTLLERLKCFVKRIVR